MVALCGVVVDDVEDHLDPGSVQGADHALELLHLLAALTGGRVGVLRSEERDGVVAPVVREPLVLECAVVDELVHGHEFDRGDAELLQVIDHGRVADSAVRSAKLLGDAGMQHRESLDVGFVDERRRVRRLRLTVTRPVEERVDDHALHHVRRGVLDRFASRACRSRSRTGTDPRPPGPRLLSRTGPGAACSGIEPHSVLGVVRAVHTVAVPLAGADGRQVRVPDVRVDVDQVDAGLLAAIAEETQLHALARSR